MFLRPFFLFLLQSLILLGVCNPNKRVAWRSVQQHNHSSSCSGSPEERSTEQYFATNTCRIVSTVLNSCYKKYTLNSVLQFMHICLALLREIFAAVYRGLSLLSALLIAQLSNSIVFLVKFTLTVKANC